MTLRRGLVIGAGGRLGYTWSVCALHRFERETAWDPRSADVFVGTSAGSVLATFLAAGVSATKLLEAEQRKARSVGSSPSPLPPPPRLRPLSLRLFAEGILGRHPLSVALVGLLPEGSAEDSGLDAVIPPGDWVKHRRCWVVAMDCGDGKRAVFGRDRTASSRDAVRASCAVPSWCAPVAIGERRYIDGGVVSPTSLDLLAGEGLDEVVVVSPLTSRHPAPATSLATALERAMRRSLSRTLDREVALLEARGTRVIRIEPTAHELARMGANFMDARRRKLVLDAWAS